MWQNFCLGRLSKRVLSRYLEHNRPHSLLAARFDSKFDPDELQLTELLEQAFTSLVPGAGVAGVTGSTPIITSLTSGGGLDEEENNEEEFQLPRREFRALFRHARNIFQAFMNDVKQLHTYGNKVLIVDRESNLMLNKLVHWLELKRVGIACVYVLGEHSISNFLTKSCDVIYMLYMASLDQKEFASLMEELSQRQCVQMHLYLSGICDLHDPIERNQLKALARLGQQRRCKVLGACTTLTERVALIDNAVENLRFVVNFARFPCEKSLMQPDGPINVHLRTLAHKMANLLDACGLFPHVGYFDSFHGLSKWVAKLTFDRMNEKRRLASAVGRDYDRDYLLLVVDRSMDLITPILHATHFRQFVSQELELIYETDSVQVDDQLSSVELVEVTDRLIQISKELTENFITGLSNRTKSDPIKDDSCSIVDTKKWKTLQTTEADLENRSSALRRHSESAEKLKLKMQQGYRLLIQLEQELIDESTFASQSIVEHGLESTTGGDISKQNLQEQQRNSFDYIMKSVLQSDCGLNDIASFDLIRFCAINLLLNRELKRSHLSPFVGRNGCITKQEAKNMDIYVSFVQKIARKNRLQQQQQRPSLESNIKTNMPMTTTPDTESKADRSESVKSAKTMTAIGDQLLVTKRKKSLHFSLQRLVRDFCDNQLDETLFPSLTASTHTPTKLIVFIIGGISFNELHLPNTAPAKHDVLFVSDTLVYPRLFFQTVVK